jgi:PAS domain S-box-containing protein
MEPPATSLTSLAPLTQADLQAAIDRNPLMVSPETTVRAAIAAMDKTGSSCVLIVADRAAQTGLIGILTERDVVRLSAQMIAQTIVQTIAQDLPIQAVMTQPVISLKASALAELDAALSRFQSHRIRYLPILDDRDRIIGVLAQAGLTELLARHVRDTSDRKQAELLLKLQNAILERIAKAEPLTEILDDLLQAMELRLHNALCSIMICDREGRLYGCAAPHLSETYLHAFDGTRMGEGLGSCGTAAFRQETVIVADIATDLLWQNLKEFALAQGLRACWSVPIIASDGRILGTFGVYHREIYTPTEQELSVVGLATNIAGIAIERQQATQALEQLNQALEAKVEQRTAALRASQERWQLVLKGTNDGIWDWDVKTDKTFYSSRWKQMRGFTDAEIGDSAEEYSSRIHPDDFDRVIAAVEDHFMGRTEFYEAEYRTQCKDGTYIWILDRGQALRDESGQVVRMSGAEKDITQHKQADRRYATLAAAAPVAIFRCDARFNHIYVNDRWSEMTGRPIESALGNGWIDALHPDDRDRLLAKWTEMYAQADPGTKVLNGGEGRHLCPDGSINWFYVQVAREMDADGRVIGYIGTLTDITDRKRIEAELAESEAKFRRLVEGANDLIWSQDQTGRFTYLSPQFQTLFGWEPSEWIGRSFIELVHPDDRSWVIPDYQRDVHLKQKSHSPEFRHCCRDGRYIWVRASSTPILNSEGVSIGRQGILTDISDRKQAEAMMERQLAAIEAANAELARATRLKDEFLANMSHELRTPLNAILGMAEGLQETVFGAISDRQRRALQTIERSGSHLLELINDILDVAKIEAGQIELECSAVSVTHLCQASLAFVKQQIFQKQIRLETKLPAQLPTLLVDERRIRQVLINLLNNAVKFTPEGGQIFLEVSQLASDRLRIAVRDTGIGIAPENIGKLFQPFVQIDSALNRQYQGTGLGLALVKRLVELHGGSVELTSELGVGSCFAIELPANPAQAERSADPLPTGLNAFLNSEAVNPAPLILLAEDNEESIGSVSSYLEAKGYSLLVAKDGQQAIDLAQTAQPDLIVMDIQMPGMDGLEAMRQIRLDPTLVSVPIVALTALAMTGDRERCLEAGANDYLTKPVRLKQLVATIQQFLEASNPLDASNPHE